MNAIEVAAVNQKRAAFDNNVTATHFMLISLKYTVKKKLPEGSKMLFHPQMNSQLPLG